ncbi:hypothetical protein E2P81_ATG08600 [Venturia nashicola]|nr:hypothetical protein E2P81_ATG08600 [Venturia nashicola]
MAVGAVYCRGGGLLGIASECRGGGLLAITRECRGGGLLAITSECRVLRRELLINCTDCRVLYSASSDKMGISAECHRSACSMGYGRLRQATIGYSLSLNLVAGGALALVEFCSPTFPAQVAFPPPPQTAPLPNLQHA